MFACIKDSQREMSPRKRGKRYTTFQGSKGERRRETTEILKYVKPVYSGVGVAEGTGGGGVHVIFR